jgi:hypothetical protein
MSDVKTKAGDGVIDQHYCCVPECKKWGGMGYGRTAAEPVIWWCAEHYPYWNMHKKS